MKKMIFISLIFLSNFSSGQEFVNADSEWVYDFNGFGGYGITRIFYQKDTSALTKNWKKFIREFTGVSRVFNDTLITNNPIYFYENDELVLYSEDLSRFDTLFQLSKPIGTKWQINFKSSEFLEAKILDTFKIEFNGELLNAQSLEYYYPPRNITFIDTILENIGSQRNYILPYDRIQRDYDGGEGGLLRCFKNDRFGTVSYSNSNFSPFDFDCDRLSKTEVLQPLSDKQNLYPNPFSDKIIVENNTTSQLLQIINLSGKVIKSETLNIGKSTIQTNSLNTGIYFVKIGQKTFKFVKLN